MSDINQQIGRRIAQVRQHRKLSQTALGEALGVSFQQVQKYERGANRISIGSFLLIAKALGVSAAGLIQEFEGEGKVVEPLPDNDLIAAIMDLPAFAKPVVIATAKALKEARTCAS